MARNGTTGATYVGIDVSTARLEVAVRPHGDAWQSNNDESGIAALVERLQALAPQLMVLEATGGLERLVRAVTAALAVGGLRVAVVNPRQVRDFAKATGRLAKTDAIAAAVLAHFAQALQPTAHPLPEAAAQALAALVERRRQLVTMLTAEKNRLQQAFPAVRAKIAAPIAWLEQALADVDGELDQSGGRPVRSGASATSRSGACRESARPSRGSCWRTCPSWATGRSSIWPRWWRWRR